MLGVVVPLTTKLTLTPAVSHPGQARLSLQPHRPESRSPRSPPGVRPLPSQASQRSDTADSLLRGISRGQPATTNSPTAPLGPRLLRKRKSRHLATPPDGAQPPGRRRGALPLATKRTERSGTANRRLRRPERQRVFGKAVRGGGRPGVVRWKGWLDNDLT